jgi:para-nitrobenzyl esterase
VDVGTDAGEDRASQGVLLLLRTCATVSTGSPFAGWGAGHWAELRYVFDHLNQYQWAWSDADRELANTMATYWTNFAKSGDPNGDSVPAWPNFTTGTERQLHFDDTITAGGVQNLQGLRLLDDRFAKFRADTPTLQK